MKDPNVVDPIQQLYDSMTEQALDAIRTYKAPPRRFRASEAGKCMRQIWYRLAGNRPAPRTAEGDMYGVCGDNDHDLTRLMLLEHWVAVGGIRVNQDNGSIEELLNLREEIEGVVVSCRADGTIETPKGKCVLEIKGTGYWRYFHLNKVFVEGGHDAALARIKEKHKEWYWQCQVMMHLIKMGRTYLIVKDRASGTLGQHGAELRMGIYIDYDAEVWDEIFRRFKYINRKLDENTPPAPEFAEGSLDCSWCSFRYLCHDAVLRKEKGLTPEVLYPGPQMDSIDIDGVK